MKNKSRVLAATIGIVLSALVFTANAEAGTYYQYHFHGGRVILNPQNFVVVFYGNWGTTGDEIWSEYHFRNLLPALGGTKYTEAITQYVGPSGAYIANPRTTLLNYLFKVDLTNDPSNIDKYIKLIGPNYPPDTIFVIAMSNGWAHVCGSADACNGSTPAPAPRYPNMLVNYQGNRPDLISQLVFHEFVELVTDTEGDGWSTTGCGLVNQIADGCNQNDPCFIENASEPASVVPLDLRITADGSIYSFNGMSSNRGCGALGCCVVQEADYVDAAYEESTSASVWHYKGLDYPPVAAEQWGGAAVSSVSALAGPHGVNYNGAWYRTSSNHVWQTWPRGDGTYGTTDWGAAPSPYVFVGTPAVASFGESRQDVFVTAGNTGGGKGHVFHKYWDNNTGSAWMDIGDLTVMPSIDHVLSSPAATSGRVGNYDVALVAVGKDGANHMVFGHCGDTAEASSGCNANSFTWTDYWYHTGVTLNGDPDITAEYPERIDAVVMSTVSGPQYYKLGGGGTQGWNAWPYGSLPGVSLRTPLTIASLGDIGIMLGATGTNGVAWKNFMPTWLSSGTWYSGMFYNVVGAADFTAH